MTDEKRYDEETQKFYDENREMIEKILAQERSSEGSDDGYAAEMLKRAAFERRMRLEYEAEKARRDAFERSERAYSDFRYGRGRTEEAFEEARDHLRDYARGQSDYFFNMFMEESERARENMRRGRDYARGCYEEDRDRFRESRERARARFNEGFDEFFGPFADTQFQRHMFGAGLEFWMALNALIRSAPFPDSVKEAFSAADENRNKEYCRKNQYCDRKDEESKPETPSQPRQIKITPLKKEE